MPVLHCISSFEGTYKKLQDIASYQFFLFLVVLHQLLISEEIIFYNFSELDSKLSENRFLSQISIF